MAKTIVVLKNDEAAKTERPKRDVVQADAIRITADEYFDLELLTKRFNNEADAIFSIDSDGHLFSTDRIGLSPAADREYVGDRSSVLGELRRSFEKFRQKGGRFFVYIDGGFWKTPTNPPEIIVFARWVWVGEPPEESPSFPSVFSQESIRAWKESVKIYNANRLRRLRELRS